MTLLKTLSRLVAATAAMALLATPIATADQGRRGNDGYRADSQRSANHRESRRGDYRRGDRHTRSDRRVRRDRHVRRDQRVRRDNRRYARDNRRYARDHRRYVNNHRRNAYNYRRAPRVSYGYSSRPVYYGSYYREGYRARHNIGGNYNCHRNTVYLTDYGRYGLYDPPRGHHWVRDNDRGDAILASVATGAIIGLVVGAIAYD